ncbi:MAG: fasciclin domain-containing protein [Salinimicrobium sp.]
MRFKTILLMSLIFPLIVFYSCKDSERGDETQILAPEEKDMEVEDTAITPENDNIFARIHADEELSEFLKPEGEVFSTRMDQPEGPYTIFAPINTAYDRLEPGDRTQLDAARREGNNKLFEYYMVDGELTVDWLKKEVEKAGGEYNARSRQGENLTFVLQGDELIVKDPSGREAKIVGVDSSASDGVVYKIDNVLRPKNMKGSASASKN